MIVTFCGWLSCEPGDETVTNLTYALCKVTDRFIVVMDIVIMVITTITILLCKNITSALFYETSIGLY